MSSMTPPGTVGPGYNASLSGGGPAFTGSVSAAVPLIDGPPHGAYIVSPSDTYLSTPPANNNISGCHLFVPTPTAVQNIGCNVTTAGDASAVIYLSLWLKMIGSPVFNQVVAEQSIAVGAGTGLQQAPISLTLAAGHYAALLRITASTVPAISQTQSPAGGFLYAIDSSEASSDFLRGGISGQQIQGYSLTGPVIGTSWTWVASVRSAAPRIFLQAA